MPDDTAGALPELIGSSPAMSRIRQSIRLASGSDEPLFLTGESGTGKDIVAIHVHGNSSAAPGRFVRLAGAGIPFDLLDRELFGHRGNGTPAPYPAVPRLLAEAQRGTLFIDDICRMPAALQARILHLLDNPVIVNEDGTAEPFTGRFISATNSNVADCLRDGSLRRDLYDRLAVLVIDLPPLRERDNDAEEIALRSLPGILDGLDARGRPLPAAALARLGALDWPGNVRQLLNTLRRMALAPGGPLTLPAEFGLQPARHPRDRDPSLSGTFAAIEKRPILEAVDRCRGSIQKAADELDLAPSTIYRKLRGWGLR